MKSEFTIEGEYIDLMQLLKATGIAQTGGHAKMLVDDGLVFKNGEVELRRRAKLYSGDKVEIQDNEIVLK